MIPDEDRRVLTPKLADERTTLVAWLEFHRETLRHLCAGLPDADLRRRTVEPSSLSLLGLVRHMAKVERVWFRRVLAGEDVAPLYVTKERPDADFDDVDTADVDEAFATWEAECARARELTSAGSLEDASKAQWRQQHVSLRWILVHMIEEYARHNGHGDLLRERLDGAVDR